MVNRKNLESQTQWRSYKKKIDIKKLFGISNEEDIEDVCLSTDDDYITTIEVHTNEDLEV